MRTLSRRQRKMVDSMKEQNDRLLEKGKFVPPVISSDPSNQAEAHKCESEASSAPEDAASTTSSTATIWAWIRGLGSNVDFKDVPAFLQGNRYIEGGYRPLLPPISCLKSMFYWNNETINIWTHCIGIIFLAVLLVYDVFYEHKLGVNFEDVIVVVVMSLSFQLCLLMSVVFHVFNCVSQRVCYTAFKYDVLGVAWATFTFYWSGVYCGYHCHPFWRYFYWVSSFLMFFITVGLHQWQEFLLEKYRSARICLFVLWAAYGVVPSLHWVFLYGGLGHPWVQTIAFRICILYFLLLCGFFFYTSKIPERFKPGLFDYIGASHQWWHIFAVLAFWWWHNTGIVCLNYLRVHGCPEAMSNSSEFQFFPKEPMKYVPELSPEDLLAPF